MGGIIDCYSKALIYLLGLSNDTRKHFESLFDMKERGIKIGGLRSGWQTGTSLRITRLAFNLWNGCAYDSEEDFEKGCISGCYVVDEIFSCSYARFFMEAIKLRYPEYTNENER